MTAATVYASQNRGKMKTKSVKIPLELIEYLEKHNDGRPPGEVLLDLAKDYQRLREGIGAAIAAQKKVSIDGYNLSGAVIQYVVEERQQIETFQKDLSELKMMVMGLKLFFEKIR